MLQQQQNQKLKLKQQQHRVACQRVIKNCQEIITTTRREAKNVAQPTAKVGIGINLSLSMLSSSSVQLQ